MTGRTLALAAAVALALPCTALASGTDLGNAVQAKRDSSRFLPRWLHASLDAGVSWMQSPRAVSDRYNAGVAFGGTLAATANPRLRLAVRLEYLDLPSGEAGFYGSYQTVGGEAYVTPEGSFSAFSGGHSVEGLATASVRPWRNLWLEAGAGHGYFSSGFPRIQFIDGTTGEFIDIPGQSGWGPAFTTGLSYEFTVMKRDHLFAYARWTRLERDGMSLDFIPLGLGYRFR